MQQYLFESMDFSAILQPADYSRTGRFGSIALDGDDAPDGSWPIGEELIHESPPTLSGPRS
jgi:hypothetical protein